MNQIHPQNRLAKIARECQTKKELSKRLKGRDLMEAWRIKQIQNARHTQRNTATIGNCYYGCLQAHLTPQPASEWRLKQLSPAAFNAKQWVYSGHSWGGAHLGCEDFSSRLAKKIKKGWNYFYLDKNYHLSLHHNSRSISYEASRSASSYDTFYVTIQFDLLRQEAVWIGGMLTIRAKSDAHKHGYPCSWFVQAKGAPGLILKRGRIENRNHHVEDESVAAERRRIARERAFLKRCGGTTPPARSGWITRQMSINAGNCPAGTDNFIRSKLIPHLEKSGFQIWSLEGVAIRKELLFSLEKSEFTRRLSRA